MYRAPQNQAGRKLSLSLCASHGMFASPAFPPLVLQQQRSVFQLLFTFLVCFDFIKAHQENLSLYNIANFPGFAARFLYSRHGN